jgi:hypothetical protein
MYAAVPRITPCVVIAGLVIVGELTTSAGDALGFSAGLGDVE